ncbi:MFS transporter [Paenibacillus thermoaerophilus]|uniref:MFS transporter n=1 Tax=Paenibacillus thermoaerophilus TaxID=1215385 RepID=A0ABW2V5U9_9BACL|nr:MFS transporter [Paenibacillus thermoaerophilus]TMV07502.1 MFS transporter [Paenibacillus thermoaerophilus]
MKRERRAWVLYDWANSAFATTMMAAVLPVYYSSVAAYGINPQKATSYWGLTQSAATFIVAVLSPLLGAIADYSGMKARFLKAFALLGILGSGLMAFVGQGDYLLASVIYLIGSVGYMGGNGFYDSLLTDLAAPGERDQLSARGYAGGYIGGGLLLAVNLLMIEKYEWFGFAGKTQATQAVFITVAVWYLAFAMPMFLTIRDKSGVRGLRLGAYTRAGWSRIAQSLRSLRRYPELLKYMLAFWLYNDGISTIISMATIYGSEIGIGTSHLIAALLITQFVGIPFTYAFGGLAKRIGAKKGLYLSLSVYVVIVGLGYFMTSALHFYALAVMVGFVQGGSQALSRSIFSRLVPADRSAEWFGFLTVSSRFSAVLGPAVFSLVGLWTGSSRLGILALLAFFVSGIFLLMKVDLAKGEREASAAHA